jgi:hypothetical protein
MHGLTELLTRGPLLTRDSESFGAAIRSAKPTSKVDSEPRSDFLETESAGHPSEIGKNPLGQAKKRKNAERENSRRCALTGVAASFAVQKGTPPVGLEPTTRRLTDNWVKPQSFV